MSKADIISRSADCSVRQFMQAWFDNKLHVLVIEGKPDNDELIAAFEAIYLEYLDYSGLGKTYELELLTSIQYINTRIQVINIFIRLQREFIHEFNMPFLPAFKDLKRFGYHLYWDKNNPNAEAFLLKMNQIEIKEKRFIVELDGKIKALLDYRKQQQSKKVTPTDSRKQFIKTLNHLHKYGFQIDKDKCTVEELALMIKDYQEEAERQISNAYSK